MSDERPYRLCESCHQVDNHPRHTLVTSPGNGATPAGVMGAAISEAAAAGRDLTALLAQAQDDSRLDKHMDCCAAEGCSVCAEVLENASAKHGLALAKALTPKDN